MFGPSQVEVSEWLIERFGPDRDLGAQFHKLISEVGELSDAILGRHEGFPPPAEGWEQNLRDEAADVVLTIMAIAVTEKFSLGGAVADKWRRRKRGPASPAPAQLRTAEHDREETP
jgi:NTP pyrophosphatase (non-canonical NTP hydrolase)